ncbi:hypothetical protein BRADI_1g64226v3 [Brachypodium distachyon]|uniref:Uncharacterized protein n=1 Tax=Brachypodium distachyon TaxID=15368 RepID=A0A0Q3HGY6_BRADI|nr:hypothetical protein BRADI_1g64226v3 [Brachypodium distachyon]
MAPVKKAMAGAGHSNGGIREILLVGSSTKIIKIRHAPRRRLTARALCATRRWSKKGRRGRRIDGAGRHDRRRNSLAGKGEREEIRWGPQLVAKKNTHCSTFGFVRLVSSIFLSVGGGVGADC